MNSVKNLFLLKVILFNFVFNFDKSTVSEILCFTYSSRHFFLNLNKEI